MRDCCERPARALFQPKEASYVCTKGASHLAEGCLQACRTASTPLAFRWPSQIRLRIFEVHVQPFGGSSSAARHRREDPPYAAEQPCRVCAEPVLALRLLRSEK